LETQLTEVLIPATGARQNYLKPRHKHSTIILILCVILLLVIIGTIGIGIADVSADTAAKIVLSKIPVMSNAIEPNWTATQEAIILTVRLPRVLLGAVVGFALAAAGCILQGLFRNPMAGPYFLGISSGASFGAAIAIVLTLFVFGTFTLSIMAFIFALLTTILVYLIARKKGRLDINTVLLVGMAINLFFSSLVSLMMYIADEQLRAIVFWIMGGLWSATWTDFYTILPMVAIGFAVAVIFSRDLNVILNGEDQALSLGINVSAVSKILLFTSALITAAAVSVSGCIGFIGLVGPHITRRLVGPDNRVLLPASGLCGAIFLVLADTIARTISYPVEIPVGVIMGLVGAPFFVSIVLGKSKKW
jgi:iron complex transport system permease protein